MLAQLKTRIDSCSFHVFDFDGTLVLYNRPIEQTSVDILRGFLVNERGVDPNSEFIPSQWTRGQSVIEAANFVCRLLELATVAKHEGALLIQQAEAVLIEQMKRYGVTPVEGIAKYLEYVQHQDKVLAIASSASMERIHVGLELSSLGQFFPEENRFSSLYQAVIPGAEAQAKPDPAVYISAAAKLNIPAKIDCNTQHISAVAYEDSIVGLQAANAANYETVVGYDQMLNKLAPPDRRIREQALKDAGAHQVIAHWNELIGG